MNAIGNNEIRQAVKIGDLVNGAGADYKGLMRNVKDKGYNMGEIVFRNGSFTRVNNHAGCLAFLNNEVTTAEQNRATNAAVFKALLDEYDAGGEDHQRILQADIATEAGRREVMDLLGGKSNPYIKEAFGFLLCGNDEPLSRDEMRLLDDLLKRGRENREVQPDDVDRNRVTLSNLREIKSGTRGIDGGMRDENTSAEFWVTGLHVKNITKNAFNRVTTETVNKLAAKEESDYRMFVNHAERNLKGEERKTSGRDARYAKLVLSKFMPKLLNAVNENIRNAKKLPEEGFDKSDVDRFLSQLTKGIDGRFEFEWAAFVKASKEKTGNGPTVEDLDGLKKIAYEELIDFIGSSLHRQYRDQTAMFCSKNANDVVKGLVRGPDAGNVVNDLMRGLDAGDDQQTDAKRELLKRLYRHDYDIDKRFVEPPKEDDVEENVVHVNVGNVNVDHVNVDHVNVGNGNVGNGNVGEITIEGIDEIKAVTDLTENQILKLMENKPRLQQYYQTLLSPTADRTEKDKIIAAVKIALTIKETHLDQPHSVIMEMTLPTEMQTIMDVLEGKTAKEVEDLVQNPLGAKDASGRGPLFNPNSARVTLA